MKQLHILTVDCEEYFQPGAPCSQWDRFQQRVDYSTRLMLDLLDESRAMATFFVVGWVAERNQALVREIVNRGHAVACHSYWHRLVYELGVVEFREETRRARSVIEQTIGTRSEGTAPQVFPSHPNPHGRWKCCAKKDSCTIQVFSRSCTIFTAGGERLAIRM